MGGTLLQVSHSWHTRSPSAIGYYHSFGLSCCAHTERDYTPPKRSQGKRIINIPPKEEEEEEKKTFQPLFARLNGGLLNDRPSNAPYSVHTSHTHTGDNK